MTAVLSGRIWCAYRSRALAAIALLTDLRVDHFHFGGGHPLWLPAVVKVLGHGELFRC
jgi:hypothetical protein